MAYITGRLIGRHKMSPVISPNKTIEGAAGGIIFGAVAAIVLNLYLELGMGLASVVILSVVIGVVAIIGDLAESVIKRGAGVKDSGSIIPGHGGVLDRIDSIIFTVPVLYYYILLYYRTGV
jgi:phosphatidate cytidylyltransferase